VSASRKEMVEQLLKDIVEAAESPTLTTTSTTFDRFGFRIEADHEGEPAAPLEEKAERLRRQVADASETVAAEVRNGHFCVTRYTLQCELLQSFLYKNALTYRLKIPNAVGRTPSAC
jgi:hypothetical protein